jgi:hypothetical protein
MDAKSDQGALICHNSRLLGRMRNVDKNIPFTTESVC